MTIGMSAALRNARLDAITAAAGANAKLRIYSGTRPATGGTATTLLAELTCAATLAAAASGGVLTFNAITADSAADATGTATWARLVTSAGTFLLDMSVGTSAAEIIMPSTAIQANAQVSISSGTLTEGNA